MIHLKHILFIILGLLPCISAWAADVCDDFSRWYSYVITEPNRNNGLTKMDTTYFTPNEFFGPSGAMAPTYTGSIYQTPGYMFRDTSCYTNDFEIEAEIIDVIGGGYHLVFGISVDYEPTFDLSELEEYDDDEDYEAPNPLRRASPLAKKSADPHKIEISLTDDDIKRSPLRQGAANANIITMGFRYHNDTLYFYRHGEMYREQYMKICKVMNFSTYWIYGGGGLQSIRFDDYTNDKHYFEDFQSCDSMQLFEECPPDPVVELRARYELPSCQDPSLRFYCESNVLEDFHWVAPDGSEFSNEKNPTITDGLSALSGSYYVWGKLHRCAYPVYVKLDVDIVQPEPIVDTVKVTTCSSDTLTIGGVLATENGFYREETRTTNGLCDSIIIYDVYVLHPKEEFVDLTICEGDSIAFNGKFYKEEGIYVDAVKSQLFDCDSLHYGIYVTRLPSYLNERNDSICWGESLLGYTESGTYIDSLTTVNGCDSINKLNLFVYTKIESRMDSTHICEGDTLWIGEQPITEGGEYELNMGSVGKCDSFVVVSVIVDSAFSLSQPEPVMGCQELEAPLIVDSIPNASYSWQPAAYLSNASSPRPWVKTNVSVAYKVTARRGLCADSTSVNVLISSGPIIEKVELSGTNKEATIIASGGEPDYLYKLNEGEWQSSPEMGHDLSIAGTNLAYIRDAYGCESSFPFYCLIPITPEDHLSPNGDGYKDTWEIENIGLYKHYTVKIFDRYGKLLIKYQDEYTGWDGTYLGHDMPATDYWYIISVDELDYEISGHFTLLRM